MINFWLIGHGETLENAEYVEKGEAYTVANERHFIANPDLPNHFRLKEELPPNDRTTIYCGAEKNYKNYHFLESRKN